MDYFDLIIYVCGVASWIGTFVFYPRFCSLLADRHPELHAGLGHPVLFGQNSKGLRGAVALFLFILQPQIAPRLDPAVEHQRQRLQWFSFFTPAFLCFRFVTYMSRESAAGKSL